MSDSAPPLDTRLLRRAAVGLVVVVAVAGVSGVLLREPITTLAEAFLDTFGMVGLFVAVMLIDSSPFPLTHEPVLLLGVATGVDWWLLGAVASAASVTAGPIGYLGGTALNRWTDAAGWLERRAPGILAYVRRWGATGVAIAAVLPIPFAVATWTAGLCRVSFPKVLAASTLRIPKTLLYLSLLTGGWALGG